jgi:uncharacterized repeat protein (TIGR01451 family)
MLGDFAEGIGDLLLEDPEAAAKDFLMATKNAYDANEAVAQFKKDNSFDEFYDRYSRGDYTVSATGQIQYITPNDPNDIFGPAGYGPQNFVTTSQPLAYTIDFENDGTAPAQNVTVTTQLDSNLNYSSFRLTGFGFDNQTYTLSGNQAFLTERLDLTAAKGYYVDVSADVNVATGLVTWTFSTIDPATGQAPTDAQTGFLPVNDSSNDGDGFVSYTVNAKSGVQTGDVVTAQATVVFDTQGPINTAAIANTLDVDPPTSEVAALPAQTDDTTFEVDWSGEDNAQGPGIASYTIYVSEDGGPATVWQSATTATNALFTGALGHTYAFYSTATDYAGITEAMHTTPDTTILVGSDSSDVTIAATSATQPEGYSGTTPYTFTVTRTGATAAAQTVAWAVTGTGDNPAAAANFAGDVLPGGTVTFAPGDTSETVTVDVVPQAQANPDLGFTVTLSQPSTGVTIDTATASGTIQNDFSDVSIAAANADQEASFFGSTAFTFTVTRTGDTSGPQTVDWSATGSGTNPAAASTFSGDVLPSGTVTFAPGQTSETVTVDVAQIATATATAGFTVGLSDPSTGAVLTTASADGTIEAQPVTALNGQVFSFKSLDLLTGVSLDTFSAGAPASTTGTPPVMFQNARIDANGNLEVDVYGNAGTGAGNFDLTLTGPSAGTASFSAASLPSGWTVEQNQSGGTFSVAAIGLTSLTSDTLLGTLTWSLPSGTTDTSIAMTAGRIGDTTVVPQALDYTAASSSTAGAFNVSTPALGNYSVSASLGTSGIGNAITSADALAALKLAVGINPNPINPATGTAAMVSPYQYIAADVTGSGQITALDALDILKMAVKLPTAPTPEWQFVNAATSYWNPATHAFTVTRTDVPTDLPTSIPASGSESVDLVGILTGDVNGALALPAGGSTVSQSAIVALAEEAGTPVDQFGIASYTAASAVAAANGGLSAPLPVADTAADVSTDLDALQTLASNHELGGIWLTGSGTVLTATAGQVAADAGAISEIVGTYTLAVSGTGGASTLDLSATTVPATVGLGADTASVSSGLNAPSMTFMGTPDVIDLGSGATAISYSLAAASGVEEINSFAYGLDTLSIALNGVSLSGLSAVDTTIGGQSAVFLSSAADPLHGVALLGLGTGHTAADLLANHVTVAGGYATIT